MISYMVAATMVAVVGATVTMKNTGAVDDRKTTEDVVAAAFFRYKKSIDCYAGLNPGVVLGSVSIATLKASGCLNSTFQPLPTMGNYVTLTYTYTYMSGNMAIKGQHVPSFLISAYMGPTATGGYVDRLGRVVNPFASKFSSTGIMGVVPSGVPGVSTLSEGSILFMTLRS